MLNSPVGSNECFRGHLCGHGRKDSAIDGRLQPGLVVLLHSIIIKRDRIAPELPALRKRVKLLDETLHVRITPRKRDFIEPEPLNSVELLLVEG